MHYNLGKGDLPYSGVYLAGNVSMINNNTFSNNDLGIRVYSGSPIITNNRVYNSGSYGLSIHTCDGAVITNNIVINSDRMGIQLARLNVNCTVSDNIISDME